MHIPVFGNGDVDSPEKAKLMFDKYGVDGVMIGRASIGYPWIFREIKNYLTKGERTEPPTIEERVEVCREHLIHSLQWKGEKLGILEMRRHYANYFRGLPNIKPYRAVLVTSENIEELNAMLSQIIAEYKGLSVKTLEESPSVY